MPNNATELTHRLLRALDSQYNVIDMPSVIEIISLLEKVAITKELLETTRLGKHVNELRRKTTNDLLSKRAKELVKKWRSMVLPEPNGHQVVVLQPRPPAEDDVRLAKKRPPTKELESVASPPQSASCTPPLVKRPKLNGLPASEFDFSDNSNSSFKEVLSGGHAHVAGNSPLNNQTTPIKTVIVVNSDSNSSITAAEPPLDQQMPKKRGRKKGSKNTRSLLDEAESSFTSKLAVSRGNSKVKTTQELLASLQNKSSLATLSPASPAKKQDDLSERAAKLTERVSIIDQKLNTNANRFKNSQRRQVRGGALFSDNRESSAPSAGSVINDKSLLSNSGEEEEDVIVVDEEASESQETDFGGGVEGNAPAPTSTQTSLSIEEALALLPPIEREVLAAEPPTPPCTCLIKQPPPTESEYGEESQVEVVEDEHCPAKIHLDQAYNLDRLSEDRVRMLHDCDWPNVNGNVCLGTVPENSRLNENGLYENVVPNVNSECRRVGGARVAGETFQRYSISEGGARTRTPPVGEVEDPQTAPPTSETFCEWHEVIEQFSYNGEVLKILPYVIID